MTYSLAFSGVRNFTFIEAKSGSSIGISGVIRALKEKLLSGSESTGCASPKGFTLPRTGRRDELCITRTTKRSTVRGELEG